MRFLGGIPTPASPEPRSGILAHNPFEYCRTPSHFPAKKPQSSYTEEEALALIGKVNMDLIDGPEEFDKMIAELNDNEELLDEWEKDFMYDITVRFTQSGTTGLSIAQRAKIHQMYCAHIE